MLLLNRWFVDLAQSSKGTTLELTVQGKTPLYVLVYVGPQLIIVSVALQSQPRRIPVPLL